MEITDKGANEEVEISSVVPSSGTFVERDNERQLNCFEVGSESIKTETIDDQSQDLSNLDSDPSIEEENNACKSTSEEQSLVLKDNAESKQSIKVKKKKASSLDVWKDVLMGKSNFERKKKLKNIHHSNITSHNEAVCNPLSSSVDNTNAVKGSSNSGTPSDLSQNKLQSNLKQSLPDGVSKPFTPNNEQLIFCESDHLPLWNQNLENLKRKTRVLFNKASKFGFNSPVGAEYKKALQAYKSACRDFKRFQCSHKHWNYLMYY